MDRETEIIKAIKEMGVFRTPYKPDEVSRVVSKAIKALEEQKTGITIPDNATNGDVIKALFPNGVPKDVIWTLSFDKCLDWWNAPYKREEK